ncbi:MAG: type 4a pilus biogenesis protein PilO [Candidatus Omnitrophica bacterium]|nr:type 4a pilus biogenesis protein PilO [Candidatus Omnitrophota bacterium]MBU1906090.1 type 4a pilus biogenesis protein PilO [Candidatus Omnitrophota bacterium]
MEISELITKYKAIILNITIILLTLFIISKLNTKQQNKLKLINQGMKSESQKTQLLDSISKTEKKLTSYDNFLVRRDESAVISTMSNLAAESGVQVATISPDSGQQYDDYIKLPFNLTLKAPDYHSLGRFVSKLESHSDIFVVENAQILSGYNQESLKINLTVSYVVLKK